MSQQTSQYISFPSRTAKILKDHDIRLKKSLGQNFLIDTNVLKKIIRVSGISGQDTVLEIGSGIGSLTELLIGSAEKIICVEIDKRLISVFKELFADFIGNKIILIEADAMHLDYVKITHQYGMSSVVANLPYKIAAPLILKILNEAPEIKKMYLTIQKDIAIRLTAKKGDKNYSSYSVKANFLADFKNLFIVQRTCFIPVPFVDSAFIEVSRKSGDEAYGLYYKHLTGSQIKEFFDFIDSCFLHRRKKLINSISDSGSAFFVDKIDLIAKMLRGIGKDRNVRAEELEPEDFLKLFVALKIPEN